MMNEAVLYLYGVYLVHTVGQFSDICLLNKQKKVQWEGERCKLQKDQSRVPIARIYPLRL